MPSSTKKSAISSSKPVFDPDTVLTNRILADKLAQMWDDFERPARMILQRQGLNSESETKCLAEWLERRLRLIRNDGVPVGLTHQAFG